MPQINRIRVSNIKYNFGTQFYDDFVMRFSCRNSLYDLANGGGKSVLMLLLMQNLLPNCTLDEKQPVEKLFRSGNGNTAIHSLIEWKLDSCDMRDGFRYMTTGFCARKAKESGEEGQRASDTASIEYFNYCIFYKEFGENDIKNLPLKADGERMGYNGLKTYLRGLEKKDSGLEVHIFDRRGEYQSFIGNYGLYESQWEIVRGINRTEGHVRTYFENSYRTTRKVIEDLLIEEIIEKSYNNRIGRGESDDEEMAGTLLDIKDKLIELARRRDEIHNYDAQIGLLSGFGGGLEELRRVYSEKQRTRNGLLQCLMSCRAKLSGGKKEAEALEEQGRALAADYQEASRLAALAELETELLELDSLSELIEGTAKRRDDAREKEQKLSEQLAAGRAAADYEDYLEYRRKYDEVRELLNSKGLGHEELVTELGRLAASRLEYTEREEAALEERRLAMEKAAGDAGTELERAREREQELFARINACKGTEAELLRGKEKNRADLDELMRGTELLTAESAEAMAEENTRRIENTQKEIDDIEKAAERNRSKLAELERERGEAALSADNGRKELMRLEEELAAAVSAEEKRGRLMEIYGVTDAAGLSAGIEYIYAGLTGERLAAGRELEKLASYRESIKKHRLPEYDEGFETVLEYLKGRYGGDVQSGQEFIGEMTADEAAEAVGLFPQLPYVILAGDSYESLTEDRVLTAMNTGSYVIPIIRRDSWRDGIEWAAAYRNMGFLWDEAALAAELDKTGEDEARLEERLEKLEDKCGIVKNDLTAAQLLENAESPAALREKIAGVKNRILECSSRLESLSDELEAAENAGREYREALETARKSLDGLKESAHTYVRIKELNKETAALSAQLAETVRDRKEAERERGIAAEEGKRAADRLAQSSAAAREASERHAALRKDFADNFKPYLTGDAKPFENMPPEQLDARAGALRSLLREEQGDAADKERLLAVYESSMQKSEQNMLYAGISLEEAKRLYGQGSLVKITGEKLQELNAGIMAAASERERLDSELSEQTAKKNRLEGSCGHGRMLYEKQFGEFRREKTDAPRDMLLKYRREMSSVKERQLSVGRKLKELENSLREGLLMEKDLERIIRSAGLAVPDIPEGGAETAPEAPSVGYEELQRTNERLLSEENRLKNKFYRDKQTLVEELEKCRAYELAQELRGSMEFPASAADIDALVKGLSDTNECIGLERDRIEKTMRDMERIKDSFENRCVQICTNIRTELDRFPKLSRITLEDEVIPIVTLAVPYIKEEMYKERMSVYINETVSGAETFDDRESKLKYIKSRLSWKKLFSVIVTDMNSIRLCLYKREHIKDQSRYLRYEEAVGSTGQSQGIYIQFLIAVINYISSLNAAGKDTSLAGKTVFIDNPFGAAKDVYIWEPIFKMLSTNHVQLIVPARGVTPAITKMFDVNYILGQKLSAGRQETVVVDYRSQVQSEEMDYERFDFEQAAFDFV